MTPIITLNTRLCVVPSGKPIYDEAVGIGSKCGIWVDTGYDDKAGCRTGRCGRAR